MSSTFVVNNSNVGCFGEIKDSDGVVVATLHIQPDINDVGEEAYNEIITTCNCVSRDNIKDKLIHHSVAFVEDEDLDDNVLSLDEWLNACV